MKFGGFYELQPRVPGGQGSEHKLFKNALEQVELSDRVGYDYIWATEHHFLEEYAHSSAPEVFLGGVQPAHEELPDRARDCANAAVHQPSGARGGARRDARSDQRRARRFRLWRGATETELGGFHVPQDEKKAMFLEGMRIALRMMVEQPFGGYESKYLKVPQRNVVPKPLQKPHPPLWMACSRRESILQAARLGVGALTFSFVSPEEARQWVKDYYWTSRMSASRSGMR